MLQKEGIVEGIVIVIGAVLAGLGSKMLPAFAYSQIVYGIVGIFLVILAVGWMKATHKLVGAFTIGLGAGLGTQIYPGLTGLATGSGGSK
jgi:hypothetical protein